MLVVLTEDDFVADRSFGNLPEVQTILAGELNAYDILVNDWVVFTDETLPGTPKVFSAVEIDVVEDADGNVVEVVETEVDVVVDATGHVTEIVETEVDEVLGRRRRGRRRGRDHRSTSTVGADGEVTGVTETEVVEVADEAEEERVVRDPHNVLIRPVVSEKSYSLMDNNVYVFVVDPSATKIDVRHAVEQAFDVRVDQRQHPEPQGQDQAQPARAAAWATAPTPSGPSSPSPRVTRSTCSRTERPGSHHGIAFT